MPDCRKLVLKRRPKDEFEADLVELVEAGIPDPRDGEFVVSLTHLTIDLAVLNWMREGRSYMPNIAPGDVVRAVGVGTVFASRHEKYGAGDMVLGLFGARTHALSDGAGAVKVDPTCAGPAQWAGGLSLTTGFTGYVGLHLAERTLSGKTVLVSGVSGQVGAIVAQLARERGARVVGTAAGAEMCAAMVQKFGLDACIDYRAADFETLLVEACPDRIDVYYDNSGGRVLDAALGFMNVGGRIIVCGTTADRGAPQPYAIRNTRYLIHDRIAMRGFVVFDHSDLYSKASSDLADAVKERRLVLPHDDVVHTGGLDELPTAYRAMKAGKGRGKHVLALSAGGFSAAASFAGPAPAR